MLGPKTLKTPRLWLRLLRPGVVPAYTAAAAALVERAEDRAAMLTFPAPFASHHARQRVVDADRWWREDRGWSYGIWAGPQLIGQVQIVTHGPRQRMAEVAYWLSDHARGQGYAREAVQAIIDQAKAHWPLERLEATVVPGNVASERLLLTLDFRLKGQEVVPYELPRQLPFGLQRFHLRRAKTALLIFERILSDQDHER